MIDDDAILFKAALERLAALYGKTIKLEQFEAYWEALGDLSLSQVTTALTLCAKYAGDDKYRFFPQPGTIRSTQPTAAIGQTTHVSWEIDKDSDGRTWARNNRHTDRQELQDDYQPIGPDNPKIEPAELKRLLAETKRRIFARDIP